MKVRLACIVEGHGEVSAVPILLRRIFAAIGSHIELDLQHPIRLDRSKVRRPGELEKRIQLAADKVGPRGAVLVLMDADDDCPAELAADLLKRAQSERSDLPIAVVVAAREFESWFIASADSLRERFSPGISIEVPANPESIRGAKEWLRDRLLNGKYAATVDQPSLAAKFDLRQARSASASFDKLWREMERVIANLEHR